MNKRLHRVVFNAARGLKVVVSEAARSSGRGAGAATSTCNAATARSVIAGLAVVAAFVAGMADAQIIASPAAPSALRPSVVTLPNGVPLVNITTPSAAGVSRNIYGQFDVQRNGVVLNNSAANSQTQLGGFTPGNPSLGGGAARVIVNEVQSTSPSYLRGPVEVAGSRAEVVVANPNGIQVEGGAFINTSRVTLTTGQPQYGAQGSLEGYVVSGGKITIAGQEFDVRGQEVQVLARAIEVNTALWADYLKLVAGANQLSADGAVVGPATPVGPAPQFSIDVGALGSMYAGRIRMTGSEHGLGVRNLGGAFASGEFVLTADGRIENRGTLEAASVQVKTTGDIDNRAGTIRQASGVGLALNAGALSNTAGGVIGREPVPVASGAPPALGGPPSSPGTGSGTTTGSGSGASNLPTTGPSVPQPGFLSTPGAILNDGGRIYSNGAVAVNVAGLNNSGGKLSASSLTMNAAALPGSGSGSGSGSGGGSGGGGGPNVSSLRNVDGTLDVANRLDAYVDSFDNTRGIIRAGSVSIASAGDIGNVDGKLSSDGAASLVANGVVDTTRGTIEARGDVSITAARLQSDAASVLSSAGNLSVTTTQDLVAAGTQTAAGRLSLLGASIDLSGSRTSAANIALVATQGNVDTRRATIATPGALSITANQSVLNDVGSLRSGGPMSIRAGNGAGAGLQNQAGQMQSTADLSVQAGSVQNTGGLIRATGTTTINAGSVINANTQGANQGIEGRDIAITSTGQVTNTSGAIGASRSLSVDAASVTFDGRLASQGDLRIAVAGDVSLLAGSQTTAGKDLSLSTSGDIVNEAALLAGGTLSVAGRNINNTASGEMTGTDTIVRAAETFTNRGLIDSSGSTQIDAAQVSNLGTGRIYGDRISMRAGVLENLPEVAPSGITSAATIAARDTLDIGAGTIHNRDHALLFSAGGLFIGGDLDANRFAVGRASVLNNASATIEALGQMSIAADAIHNTDAHVQVERVRSDPVAGVHTITPLGGIELPADHFVLDHSSRTWATVIDGQFLTGKGWLDRQYYETTEIDRRVGVPDPGRILAGNNLSVDGMLHNRDSQVIAGGQIDIAPGNVDNTPTLGQRIVSSDGLSFLVTPTPGTPGIGGFIPLQQSVYTIDVGASRFEAGSSGGGSGSAPTARTVSGPTVEVSTGAGPDQPVVRTVSKSPTLPTSSLFTLHPEPTSRYLIETDPRFTQESRAGGAAGVSSDALLIALGYGDSAAAGSAGQASAAAASSSSAASAASATPALNGPSSSFPSLASLPRRLGDAFYEQWLIRQQIAELTGYRYLDTFTNDTDQFIALINAGVTFARAFQLTPGVALSAEQMAQLTSDIVWLVEETVTLPDGSTQRVLVPKVYLRVRPGAIDGSGALLSADRVIIRGNPGSGDLNNLGTIAGRTIVSIQADAVINSGRITGGRVGIEARGDINDVGGSIDAGDALTLRAGGDINVRTSTNSQNGFLANRTNVDRVASLSVTNPGGTLIASAGQDVNLIGAVVSNAGKGGLTSLSAGRDVNLGTVTESQSRLTISDAKNYRGDASSNEIGTRIRTDGLTLIGAGRDVNARQATIDAGTGLLSVHAERDVRIVAGQSTEQIISGNQSVKKGTIKSTTTTLSTSLEAQTSQGSSIAGDLFAIHASNDLNIEGSRISGNQGVLLAAGNQLSVFEGRSTVDASAEVTRSTSGIQAIKGMPVPMSRGRTNTVELQSDGAAPSRIESANGGIAMQANVIQLQGVEASAKRDVTIQGGEVTIQGATSSGHGRTEESTRGARISSIGVFDPRHGPGAKNVETVDARLTTLAPTTITGANVDISATGTLALVGAVIDAGTVRLRADTLALAAQTTETSLESSSQGRDWMVQRNASDGRSDQTTHYTRIGTTSPGTLTVKANRIQADLGARDSIESLARQPGMAWVDQLQADPKLQGAIDWRRVEEAHRDWKYDRTGLTPEGAAVVTLVTAYFTAGAASSAGASASAAAGGGTTGAIVGGAVSAGVTALAGQAAVALANNRGDLGGALDDLGRSASVKNLVSAIVTGGALGALNLNPSGLPTEGAGAQTFTDQLRQNVTAGAARAFINTAINGGSLEDNLRSTLRTALLDTVAAQGANAIGDMSTSGTLDDFTNKFAHAIAGCAVGAARGVGSSNGCAAGALGAAIGELAAEAYGRRGDAVQFAALMSGIAVALSGGDAAQIGVGSQAGGNAAASNYLNHDESAARARLIDDKTKCTTQACTEEKQAQIDTLNAVDRWRDRQLNTACTNPSAQQACSGLYADLQAAGTSYDGAWPLPNSVRAARDGITIAEREYAFAQAYPRVYGALVAGASTVQGAVAAPVLLGGLAGSAAMGDAAAQDALKHLVTQLAVTVTDLPAAVSRRLQEADIAETSGNSTRATQIRTQLVLDGTFGAVGGTQIVRALGWSGEFGAATLGSDLRATFPVENNFYRDGGMADPAIAMSARGPWRPSAALTTAEANAMVTGSVPRGVSVLGSRSADLANASEVALSYSPPYLPGTTIVEGVTTQPINFSRVYVGSGGRSRQSGAWILRSEDIAGLTPLQIASKFALPQIPTMITDVTVPAGVRINISAVNGVSPLAADGIHTGGNGGGGGVQFALQVLRDDLNPAWFTNERALK